MDHGDCAFGATYGPILLLDGSQELDQAERLRSRQRSGWRLGGPGPLRIAGGHNPTRQDGRTQLESQGDQNASKKPGNDKKKPRNSKWVLVVNLNPGSVAGGSGAQYFIGNFDGTEFTAENIIDPTTPPSGIVFQNFESGNTFADLGWTATEDFVDKGPVTGSLPGQGPVSGFLGSKLVNTFFNGDSSVGTITSPTFTVSEKYINLLVGGGKHPHDPNTSDDPQPPGALLFTGADVEPTVPGTTTYEELGWTATDGLVSQPVPTGAIGGQQPVSGFQGIGLINTFTNGNDAAQGTLTSPVFTIEPELYQFPDRRRQSSLSGQQ